MAEPTDSARLTAGVAAGVASLTATGAALVVDRRVQRADARRAALAALEPVLLPLFLEPPSGNAGSLIALLRADRAVVDFWGRRREQELLGGWLDDEDASPVLVLSGPAGAGKTRLALHWASNADGWRSGVLAAGRGGDVVELVRAAGMPALAVVDDADTRPDLGVLLEQLAAQRGGGPAVRALLLARDATGLRSLMKAAPGAGSAIEPDRRSVALKPLGGLDDRRQRFDSAVRSFASELSKPSVREAGYALTEGNAREPILTLHIRALVAAAAGDAASVGRRSLREVLAELVDREMQWWRRVAVDPRWAIGDLSDDQLRKAMVALVLLGPTSEQGAVEALSRVPDLRDLGEGTLRNVARFCAHLYPTPDTAFGVDLAPELLGAWLVVDSMSRDDDLAAALLSGTSTLDVMAFLMRAVTDFPEALALFGEAAARLPLSELVGVVRVMSSVAGGHRGIDETLARLIGGHDVPPDVAFSLSGLLTSGAATQTRIAIIEHHVAHARTSGDRAALGTSLNELGILLLTIGRREEALPPAQETMAIYRELAETNPAAYLPDLAASLNNLSSRLSANGRREEALAAAQEAAIIYQRLAGTEPGPYLPDLATTLNTLSVSLSSTGRPEEALPPAQEAVIIHRRLAETNPAAYLPGLAMTLNTLGSCLSANGRREEALAAAQEAVTIRRRLAETNRAAYLPSLAMALNNLGVSLSKNGRWEGTLPPVQEAVTIYRGLAEANPSAYLPDLAMTLNTLGSCLSANGRREEALAPVQEAVTIRRRLAEANPAAYLPDLAESLNNLGLLSAGNERREEALPPEQEAVTIYRGLAEANPSAYLPDLAVTLSNLSVSLFKNGRWEEALAPAQEAATIRRRLAEANPAAYLPDLSGSLHNLALLFCRIGRHDDEFTSFRESLTALRKAARAHPTVHSDEYARLRALVSRQLAQHGRDDDAVLLDLTDD